MSLVRSLILSTFFASPLLLRPGMAIMRTIANSKSPLLDPDRNVLLGAILKPFVYDQFCAGRNKLEVQKTMTDIKKLGFAGVILTCGRELLVNESISPSGNRRHDELMKSEDIERWRIGNLETLDMMDKGDWLAIKFTGAGQEVTNCLVYGKPPPPQFSQAMDEICKHAINQGSRIWIDAEQSTVQSTIDQWTIELMRRYNTGPTGWIYNTIQAYLKDSRIKLQQQLRLANDEGWTLAIKLVRGAYISNDTREKIHDTKSDTDASYNGIVEDLLSGTVSGFSSDQFPKVQLFLAGHNTKTIRGATKLAKDLSALGKLKVVPEFGQLQGMADDIGCEIIQMGTESKDTSNGNTFIPYVYKCSTWGSIRECMQYLVRRAVENQGATDRMKEGVSSIAAELWRRCTGSLRR